MDTRVNLITDDDFDVYVNGAERVVILASADDCPACDDYFPTFQKHSLSHPDIRFAEIKVSKKSPSLFRRTYMVAQKIGENFGTPTTFLFERGKMVRKFFGFLPELSFNDFLDGSIDEASVRKAGQTQSNSPCSPAKMSVEQIKIAIFDENEKKEIADQNVQILLQELAVRRRK